MGWARVFGWTRNIFAVLGLLGGVLLTALVVLVVVQENQYEERSKAALQQRPKPTLDSARELMEMAQLEPASAKRLVGGVLPEWDKGSCVEAYCIEAQVGTGDERWRGIPQPQALLGPAIAQTLDSAHSRLGCIPTSADVATRGLDVRLISADFTSEGLDVLRVSVRDPVAGVYYVVADTCATGNQRTARAFD
jgi:hypothetical protein